MDKKAIVIVAEQWYRDYIEIKDRLHINDVPLGVGEFTQIAVLLLKLEGNMKTCVKKQALNGLERENKQIQYKINQVHESVAKEYLIYLARVQLLHIEDKKNLTLQARKGSSRQLWDSYTNYDASKIEKELVRQRMYKNEQNEVKKRKIAAYIKEQEELVERTNEVKALRELTSHYEQQAYNGINDIMVGIHKKIVIKAKVKLNELTNSNKNAVKKDNKGFEAELPQYRKSEFEHIKGFDKVKELLEIYSEIALKDITDKHYGIPYNCRIEIEPRVLRKHFT